MSANEWVKKFEAYNIAQEYQGNEDAGRVYVPSEEEKAYLERYKELQNPQKPTEQELIGLPDPETEDLSQGVDYWQGTEPGWNETGIPDSEVGGLIDDLLGDYNKGPEGNPLGREVYAPEGEPNLVPDSGRWPRSAFNVPLQSSPSFDIDPNKKPLTERQKGTQDKLRKRAGSGQQGARTAKEILEKKGGSALDLPTFLQGVIEKVPEAAALGGAVLWELFKPRGMFQLSELNPAQIEALKGIPPNLKDLPDVQRLQKMREITKKVKGLA